MSLVITPKARTNGFSKIGAEATPSDYGYINLIKGQRDYIDNTGAFFPEVHYDANRELIDLPVGVTVVRQYMFIGPSADTASKALIEDFFQTSYRLTWEGGPPTATISSGTTVISAVNPREIFFTLDTHGNRWADWNCADYLLDLPRNVVVVKVSNIPLYDNGEIFDPDWLEGLSEYQTLRFLGMLDINNSTKSLWSQRTPLTSKNWSIEAPWEATISLCNRMNTNGWFLIPHLATTDYIQQAARLVRDTLNPNLHASWEYTNEMWNSIFDQYDYGLAEGQSLFGTTAGNEFQDFYGMQVARMARIIDAEYGPQRNYNIVLCWGRNQYNSNVVLAPKWAAIDTSSLDETYTYIPPHQAVDAIACATYFGVQVTADAAIWPELRDNGEAAMVSLVLGRIPDQLAASLVGYQTYANAAATYGLSLRSYEGGGHISIDGVGNANLFLSEFTVPDATLYTVGETITQAGSGATGTVLSTAAEDYGLVVDTGTVRFNGTGVLTGATSGQSQTPTQFRRSNPKDGVLDGLCSALYATEGMAGYYEQNLDNWFGVGAEMQIEYRSYGEWGKFGSWGNMRSPADTANPLRVKIKSYAETDRRSALIGNRRVVTWP